MHNWWIAALEHFGILTREEAEHIANNIKLGIHRENYKEAYNELAAILGDADLKSIPVVQQLHNDVEKLTAEVESLKTKLGKKSAVPAPTGANKTVANTNKV